MDNDNLEVKDISEFGRVDANPELMLITNRGRIYVGDILDLSDEELDKALSGTTPFSAIKMKIFGTTGEYGYLVFKKDSDGVYPSYLSEAEFYEQKGNL